MSDDSAIGTAGIQSVGVGVNTAGFPEYKPFETRFNSNSNSKKSKKKAQAAAAKKEKKTHELPIRIRKAFGNVAYEPVSGEEMPSENRTGVVVDRKL